MTRTLIIDDEYTQALKLGSDFCAKLAAVEHAHLLGDEETLDMLLSNVDPIDARLCANLLRALWALASLLPDERQPVSM